MNVFLDFLWLVQYSILSVEQMTQMLLWLSRQSVALVRRRSRVRFPSAAYMNKSSNFKKHLILLDFLIIYSCYINAKYAFKVHIMQHDATRNATRKYRQGFLPAGLLFFFYYTTLVNQCKHNVFYQIVFDKFLIFPNSFCLQNPVVSSLIYS